jgi:Predicted transcriptional regulator containing the HTH domain
MERSLDNQNAQRVIEALLFTSSDPLSIKVLKKKLPESVDIEVVIETLQKHYEPQRS